MSYKKNIPRLCDADLHFSFRVPVKYVRERNRARQTLKRAMPSLNRVEAVIVIRDDAEDALVIERRPYEYILE
jgi:hypothetical protein